MVYDHSRKIGNQGDVVKHSVLYNCVVALIRHGLANGPFKYVESHCGRAVYVLPEGGEWWHGIRKLSEKPKSLLDNHPFIHAYCEAMLTPRMKVGQQYFGSSNIVFRTLRSNQCRLRLELHETEQHAYDDLRRYYFPWGEDVHLHNSCGYEGIQALQQASLVLIDPPALDADQIQKCVTNLNNNKVPFICWTPRNSSSNGNQQESWKSAEFGQTVDIGRHFNIRWAEPSGAAQQTFGCRLTVSESLADIVDATTTELATIMVADGWRRE
jgi:23S rRNA A2030 N6-methylase RlmJ